MKNYLLRLILIITAGAMLSACGGGGDSPPSPTYTVGGTISGLTSGSLVLANNGTDTLTLSANSTKFTFATAMASGTAYAVTIATQPSGLVCSVSNGSGTMNSTNISNVSISCAPHFAYALNVVSYDGSTNGKVSMYAINAVTGILEPLSTPTIATGIVPQSLVINPAGTFAYVVNTGADSTTNGNVSMYSINSSTGALTPLATPTVAAGVAPQTIAINPAGTFAYVTNQGDFVLPGYVSMYSINSSTGSLTPLSPPTAMAGISASYITINPAGTFAYVVNFEDSIISSISTYSIDPSTGMLRFLNSDIAHRSTPSELTINPAGTFAYITYKNDPKLYIYSINPSSGSLTLVSTPGLALFSPTGVTINSSGTFAYIVNSGDGTSNGYVSMYAINATTGALTPLSTPTISAGISAQYLTINSSGTFAYVANTDDNNISMYSIDKSTGILKPLSPAKVSTGAYPSFISITP